MISRVIINTPVKTEVLKMYCEPIRMPIMKKTENMNAGMLQISKIQITSYELRVTIFELRNYKYAFYLCKCETYLL